MTTNNQVSLKDSIEQMLHAYKLKGKIYEAQIVNKWANIIGPHIEKHTRDLYLKKSTLFIRVDSAALKQELTYMRTKIIDSVNEELGNKIVDDIVLL
ncbi:MAG: DUF721 domain-containing protein [Bacteroidetes bacterium]|nr:DUF721 domain-containing protein [Bacteroidota bacterium]